MEQATISIRTDAVLKRDFERLCQDIGMNMTTAFNVIMKQSVREKRIPVTLKADPAYRVANDMGMTDLQFKSYLKQLIRALEAAESQETIEKMRSELEKLKKDLQESMEG